MIRTLAPLALAALAVTACAIPSEEAYYAIPPAKKATSDYVGLAGAADLFEIHAGQIAVQRSQNPAVRNFALMLVQHHSMASRELTAAALDAGVHPASAILPADKNQLLADLASAPAANFDALYLREQLAAHQAALAVHRDYAANGRSAPLRDAAAKAAPMVEQHLQQLQTMTGG